jgi:H+/Cl- antiporter ClcA
MELVPAIAMGMGAMSVVMLRLPLTSVMLATILMGADGLAAIPLVIISVVVAFVIAARLQPPPQAERTKAAGPAAARSVVPAT